MLNKFESIDEEGLMTILSELNKKECESDPIPVKLLLQCFDEAKLILLYIRGEIFRGNFRQISRCRDKPKRQKSRQKIVKIAAISRLKS